MAKEIILGKYRLKSKAYAEDMELDLVELKFDPAEPQDVAAKLSAMHFSQSGQTFIVTTEENGREARTRKTYTLILREEE